MRMNLLSTCKKMAILSLFSTLFMSSAYSQGSSTREQFLRGIRAQIKMSEKGNDHRNARKLQDLENRLINSTDAEFAKYSSMGAKIGSFADSTEQLSQSISAVPTVVAPQNLLVQSSLQTTLSNADYSSLCGSSRRSTDSMFASMNAYIAAEVVREEALRACEETIVILGEGGNGSLVCLITDAIYFAAKITYDELSFCESDIDSSELAGSYTRIGDTFNLIKEHHSSISNDLGTHDREVKSNLSKHDTDMKSVVRTHDQDIKLRLNQLETKLDKLQAGVDKNTELLEKVIILLNTPSGRRPDWPVK